MTNRQDSPNIIYLSEPMPVSMADDYFDIADTNHFWVKRRFDIFQKLSKQFAIDLNTLRIGEIGCGHGLIQAQIQRNYGVQVDGFDLNKVALQKSIAVNNPLFLYDIHQRHPDYQNCYDLIILFDVIEHIEDQNSFIESVLYHLKPDGILAINVPALQFLYSKYDVVAGHVRRYNSYDLNLLGKTHQLKTMIISYWGFALIPILVMRKWISQLSHKSSSTYNTGFYPPSKLVNNCLYWLSKIEFIPQRFIGTSLMALYRKPQ